MNLDVTFVDEWEAYLVESELAASVGLPTERERDANCAARGEYSTTGSDAIRSQLNDMALLRVVRPISVKLGRLGRDGAALGAATLILHRELTLHRLVAPLWGIESAPSCRREPRPNKA